MNKSWFKLHRKINENPFYSNPTALAIWIEILRRVTYKERTFYNKRERITLKPGQCLVGERELANCFENMSKTTVRYWLEQFAIDRMIDRHVTAKGSIVTVLNWDKYQSIDRPIDQKKTRVRPELDPNKKEKKEKKYIVHFEKFWKKYPRKIAKKKARQTYTTLVSKNEDLIESIENGLETYLPIWEGKDKQFIPHATTWLNQGRWDDEVQPEEKKNMFDQYTQI